MKRLLSILLLSLGLASSINAQKMDKEHLTVSVFAHDSHFLDALNLYEKLIDSYDCVTAGATVGINTCPGDNNYYAWAYNFPEYGLGFSWSNMSSLHAHTGAGLGDAFTVFGYSNIDFVRTRYFSFGPRLEFGAGYHTKKWDPVTNPQNSFVGSSVLVMLGAGLEATFNITPHWEIGLQAMLFHRSNGMLKVPNFGLNGIGAGAALRYNINERYLGKRGERPEVPEYKKWLYDIYVSGGVHSCDAEREIYQENFVEPDQINTWHSTPWARINIGGTVSRRYHPLFATGIGLDMTYTGNWKRLAEYYEVKYGEKTTTCPIYVGAYIQQSVYYGNIEIAIGLGVYLFKRLGIEDSTWNYQRVLLRYHIPKAGNIFFSIAMRAHRFDRSDTLEFTFGKRF